MYNCTNLQLCGQRLFARAEFFPSFFGSLSRGTHGKSLDVTKFAWSAPPFCLRASLILLLVLATIRKREPVMQIMKRRRRRRRHRRVPFSRAVPTGRPDGAQCDETPQIWDFWECRRSRSRMHALKIFSRGANKSSAPNRVPCNYKST